MPIDGKRVGDNLQHTGCLKHLWSKRLGRVKLPFTEISVIRAHLRFMVADGKNQELVFGQVTFEMFIRYMHRDVK